MTTNAISKECAEVTSTSTSSPSSSLWRLLLVSTAGLYLELVLIRYLGTEVKIFAFYQNLSLIVCFLGFGLGCFGCKQRGSLLPSLLASTTLVALVNLPFRTWQDFLKTISTLLSYTPDAALWGAVSKLPTAVYYKDLVAALGTVTAFLILVIIAMVPLGRWVGYYLEAASSTVKAYSVNLVGSLIGIWLLAILSFYWLSPCYWFAIAFGLIVLSQPFSWRAVLIATALLGITLLALNRDNGPMVYWSPYQKLSVMQVHDPADQQYRINVNNEGYMTIANLSPAFLARNPELKEAYRNSSYDSPFQFVPSTENVLVVGSGAGNDVAAALRHGAGHVDAVEIDPLIASLGRRLHPEQPYESPRVRFINRDARNYMRQCRKKYDLILFGLLDSHTEFSGYTNMRVDNYVYTKESFQEAKRLLKPDGVLILKFEVRQPWTWMGQRFYAMLSGIFPQPPLTYYAPTIGGLLSGTVFVESKSPGFSAQHLPPAQREFLAARPPAFPLTASGAPPPTSDNWPYVYHRGHNVPRAYYSVSVIIFILTLYMIAPFFKPREGSTWLFLLLGAGFLLMETKLVSSLALYFGTTWLVNSIALTGILTVLLLANLYVSRFRPASLGIYYLCLGAGLLATYLIPWNRIPGSGTWVGILVCIAHCVPVFFAGIVFTENFRRIGGRSDAFGANMLGAVVGGLAQNMSFILGMKALLLIAAGLYGGAALLQRAKPLHVSLPEA